MGSEHFKQTKFPGFTWTNFQNSGIIISTYFPFETILEASAENGSGSVHGETKNT